MMPAAKEHTCRIERRTGRGGFFEKKIDAVPNLPKAMHE
jgi:hypothetical protein